MTKLLLIEDEEVLQESLTEFLGREGYTVTCLASFAEGQQANISSFDAVILDWMLPDGSGIDLLKQWRQQGNSTPVLMLTARADLIDKVLGFELGADDYLTKPFEPRELLARLRARIRQDSSSSLADQSDATGQTEALSDKDIEYSCLQISGQARSVVWSGKPVGLTKMEFDLLYLLATHPGRVFSRDELLDQVWGYDAYPTTRTVDNHVLQLRQKLADDVIQTVRGVGYKFVEPVTKT